LGRFRETNQKGVEFEKNRNKELNDLELDE